MLYTITVVPYIIAFSVPDTPAWNAINLFMDSLFMMDVLINCFCAYYINDDCLEVSNKKILIHYASS